MTSQHFSLVVAVMKNIIVLPQLAKTTFFNFAYYPGPTSEFTGPSVGHNYIRKNGTNLPIVALNRSLQDLSIGI